MKKIWPSLTCKLQLSDESDNRGQSQWKIVFEKTMSVTPETSPTLSALLPSNVPKLLMLNYAGNSLQATTLSPIQWLLSKKEKKLLENSMSKRLLLEMQTGGNRSSALQETPQKESKQFQEYHTQYLQEEPLSARQAAVNTALFPCGWQQTARLLSRGCALQTRFQATLLAPVRKAMHRETSLYNNCFNQFAVFTGNTQENSHCLGYTSYLANDFIINWYHSGSIFFMGFLLLFNGLSA